jgi:hypothetical protein
VNGTSTCELTHETHTRSIYVMSLSIIVMLSKAINSLYVSGFISLVGPFKERNAVTWTEC